MGVETNGANILNTLFIMKMHIPIKCSTCKYYATGMADGENSLDTESVKTAICTKHKTYDVVCPKAYRKSGCKDYHLNWDIYNKLNQAHK